MSSRCQICVNDKGRPRDGLNCKQKKEIKTAKSLERRYGPCAKQEK